MITYVFDAKVAAIHGLRVNMLSLVAEARAIRKEMRRCGLFYRAAMESHRRNYVRPESRATHLALAFVRGRKYEQVEGLGSVNNPILRDRVYSKLRRYIPVSKQSVEDWFSGR